MSRARFGLFAAIVSLAWCGVGRVGGSCCFAASLPVVDERIAEEQEPAPEDVVVIINKRALETDRVLPGAKLAMTQKSANASGASMQGLATAKFLSGPTVTMSANKLTWTSTTQELRLSLPVGTYAVDELEAPAGYLTTNMTFEVRADGKVYADLDADGAPEALPNNCVELKDTMPTYPVKVTQGGSESYYETLAEGFAAIGAGGTGTVTMLLDVALVGTGMVSVPDGCDITLDLAGKRIDWTTTNGDALFYFQLGTNGKLTIKDSASVGTISAVCTSLNADDAAIIVFCIGNGDFTVDSGTFVCSNKVGGATLFYKNGTGNWSFNGGTYRALNDGTGVADFLYCGAATGTTVIAGGTYDIAANANSGRAIGASELCREQIVIGGGDFDVSSAGTWHGAFTAGNGTLTVTNGEFNVKASAVGVSCFVAERNGTAILSNGTVHVESSVGYAYAASASATGTLVVAGGTYSARAAQDTAATIVGKEAATVTLVGSPAINQPDGTALNLALELFGATLDFTGYTGGKFPSFAVFADGTYGASYVKGDMTKFSGASIWAGYFSTRPNNSWVLEGQKPVVNTNDETKATYPWRIDLAAAELVPDSGNFYTSVQSAFAAAADGETVKLVTNVTESVHLYGAKTNTLDLAGWALKAEEGDCGISVGTDVALTIDDSRYGDPSCAHYLVQSSDYWDMTDVATETVVYGGCITGGHLGEYTHGAGINSYGDLTLKAGIICGNRSAGDGGAGGGLLNGKTFTMTGGEICYNFASKTGSGICCNGGSDTSISGGKIHHNTCGASWGAGQGGGVSVATEASLYVSGGSFCDNLARANGGGIAVYKDGVLNLTGGTVTNNTSYVGGGVANLGATTLGGTAFVKRNAALGAGINFATVKDNATVGLSSTEPLADGAGLDVSLVETKDLSTFVPVEGAFTTNGTADDVKYFGSDCPQYVVRFDTDRLYLVVPLVTYTPTALDHATATVYTNDTPMAMDASYTLISNSTAKVVYTVAEAGYYFADGSTVKTNVLDTSMSPAAEDVPVSPAAPSVMVGKPVQRYPWNGIADVRYRTKNAPVGLKLKFTVTVGETDYDGGTLMLTTAGTAQGVHAIDLRKLGLEQSRGKATVKASVVAE